jgi:hypothetical protein
VGYSLVYLTLSCHHEYVCFCKMTVFFINHLWSIHKAGTVFPYPLLLLPLFHLLVLFYIYPLYILLFLLLFLRFPNPVGIIKRSE